MLNTSPAVMDSHTPSISKICGSTSTGMTIKTMVRQNDKTAEVFPSFSAVNHPDANTLTAIITKLVATIWNPCSAIDATCTLPFAKKLTTVPPSRYLTKVQNSSLCQGLFPFVSLDFLFHILYHFIQFKKILFKKEAANGSIYLCGFFPRCLECV